MRYRVYRAREETFSIVRLLLRLAREGGNRAEIASEADNVRQNRANVRGKIRNVRALMNGAGAGGKNTGGMGH